MPAIRRITDDGDRPGLDTVDVAPDAKVRTTVVEPEEVAQTSEEETYTSASPSYASQEPDELSRDIATLAEVCDALIQKLSKNLFKDSSDVFDIVDTVLTSTEDKKDQIRLLRNLYKFRKVISS